MPEPNGADTARSDQQQAAILEAAGNVGKYVARLRSEGVSKADAVALAAEAQPTILAAALGFVVDE